MAIDIKLLRVLVVTMLIMLLLRLVRGLNLDFLEGRQYGVIVLKDEKFKLTGSILVTIRIIDCLF